MKSVARFVMYLAAVLSFLFGTTVYSHPRVRGPDPLAYFS